MDRKCKGYEVDVEVSDDGYTVNGIIDTMHMTQDHFIIKFTFKCVRNIIEIKL